MIGIIKDPSLTLTTSAFIDITAEKQMYAGKSYSATLSVLPVQPVTKPVLISLKNSVTVLKAPYVCNGCPKAIHHCSIAHKYRYDAVFADRKYKECLSSSRAGINMTKHELRQKDMVISPLIYQGQSGDSTYADACLSRMTSKAYRLEFPGRDRRVNNGN